MINRGNIFGKCVIIALVALLLLGVVTMGLWNWLVPELFNGPVISYWQSLGLLLLTKILTWGFSRKRYPVHQPSSEKSKHRMYEKFSNMSAEEREAFKQKMKAKWCSWESKADRSENSTSID